MLIRGKLSLEIHILSVCTIFSSGLSSSAAHSAQCSTPVSALQKYPENIEFTIGDGDLPSAIT